MPSGPLLDPYDLPYGPDGGVISLMTRTDLLDHVEMLLEKLEGRDIERQQKAAVALATFIADQKFLPEEAIRVHPAHVLAKSCVRPKMSKIILVENCRALAIMGPHAVLPSSCAALSKMTAHPESEVRFEAVRALRYMGPDAALGASAALAAVVADVHYGDPLLRFEAAQALVAMGEAASQAAAQSLAMALQDQDADVRFAAMQALKVMGASAAVAAEAVVGMLRTGGFEVKQHCLEVLESMGEEAAEVAAAEVGRMLIPLPNSDATLRLKAAETLQSFGKDAVRDPHRQLELAKAMHGNDEGIAAASREALAAAGCTTALQGPMALFERAAFDQSDTPRPIMDAQEAAAESLPALSSASEDWGGKEDEEEEEEQEESASVAAADAKDEMEEAAAAEADAQPPQESEDKDRPESSEGSEVKRQATFAELLAEAQAKEKQDKIQLESQKVLDRMGSE